MATATVMNQNGQTYNEDLENLPLVNMQNLREVTDLPSGSYFVPLIVGAANGLLTLVKAPSKLLRSSDAPDLPANTTLTGSEIIPVRVDGVLYKVTLNQIATQIAEMQAKPYVYDQSGKVALPNQFIAKTTTNASGIAVFYLTKNGQANGDALFTSEPNIQAMVNDSSVSYAYGWTFSADWKTLTVTAKKPAGVSVLGLTVLGLPAAVPAGTSIYVLATGKQ